MTGLPGCARRPGGSGMRRWSSSRACSLAGVLSVRQRYREAQRRISFQIQSVIDLEARAFAEGRTARPVPGPTG